LPWFPAYAGIIITELPPEYGQKMAEFLNHYGRLLLVLNDLNDLEDHSHPAGDDIGQRVNSVMKAFLACKEIEPWEKETLRRTFYKKSIQDRRRSWFELDPADYIDVQQALDVMRRRRPEIARVLMEQLQPDYDQGMECIEYFFQHHYDLFVDPAQRQVACILYEIYVRNLRNLWGKLYRYSKGK
jgi:hypothetical protein